MFSFFPVAFISEKNVLSLPFWTTSFCSLLTNLFSSFTLFCSCFWTRHNWSEVHERANTNASRRNTIKLDLRLDCCPKNGPSHSKYCWKCIATPDKTTWEQHSQSHWENIFYHTNWHFQPSPKWSNAHLKKTQLTPQPSVTDTKHGGLGSYTIQM